MTSATLFQSGRFSIRALTRPTSAELQDLERWENDPTIAHLHHVIPAEGAVPRITARELATLFRDRVGPRLFWMLEMDGLPVGFLNGAIDPPHLHRRIPGSFWPGLVIGEEWARGQGLGRQAMIWCERLALEVHCKRIELGVFEFNTVAYHLYSSLGYQEIARIPDFTWWHGRRWEDIRMEKLLNSE